MKKAIQLALVCLGVYALGAGSALAQETWQGTNPANIHSDCAEGNYDYLKSARTRVFQGYEIKKSPGPNTTKLLARFMRR